MEWIIGIVIIYFAFKIFGKLFGGGKSNSNSGSSYVPSSRSSDPGPGICYSKGGSNSCSHSWSYSHKGVDGRSIYTCSKCDRQEKRM